MPYRAYLGKVSMKVTDWTYYQAQDEAKATAYHIDWPDELKEMGPIWNPAGAEESFYRRRAAPMAPTYCGRTLRPKHADLKQQMSWGNPGEQPAILRHMRKTDEAIRKDPDWKAPLRRCQEDPSEGYLHTVLPTGEVLPFSDAVALTYEYPCTLGKEQEGLHQRLVYSSVYGIPLITPAKSWRLRVQYRREQAYNALTRRLSHVSYVPDEVGEGAWYNVDEVSNPWNLGGSHYECHHDECVMVGTARLYFVTEEEYLAHWNSFHTAISLWYLCPAQGCDYVAMGEPDAL